MITLQDIDRDILRLAIPMVIANITVPLLGIVDIAVVGHMGSPRYIAVVAVGSMMFNVMYWLMGFLRMGTSGLTAQSFGRKDGEEGRILRRSLLIALLLSAFMLVMQRPLLYVLKWLFSVGNDIEGLVDTYYSICIWGAPAVLASYALTGWFVGMQNTRVPMAVSILQNVVNIFLSLLFVYAFGWGLRGVASGTVLAQWVGGGLLLITRSSPALQQPHHSEVKGEKLTAKGPGRVFGSLFLRTLCLVAVNLFFTSMGSRQGGMMLSVNTLLMTLFTLFSYVMDGFAFAGEALCGRYAGARDSRMLHISVRRLLLWGLSLAMLFTLLYMTGGRGFLFLLTNEVEVVAAADPYRWWAIGVPLCGFMAFVYDGVFVGLTAGRAMFVSTAVGAGAFFFIYSIFFPMWGNHALWLALLTYLLLRGVVLQVYYKKSPIYLLVRTFFTNFAN